MAKHSRTAPIDIEEFEPFYLKQSLLWVPYFSAGAWRLHTLRPEIAWQGISYAVKTLTSTGKVVPFALRALDRKKRG